MESGRGRHALNDVRRKKSRRSKDHPVRNVFDFFREDPQLVAIARDSVHTRPGAYIAVEFIKQPLRDPAVALRPRERTFFLRVARSEVMNAGPCGSIFRQSAIVVAAGVVDVPAQWSR